ncbi:hypothetical protein [Ekhidna sp.]|uniref:Spy/CpxP family protein refolding chaperone n=1 Tax=Ekhidna sp. TaxID=2608089 RepID=UPI0032993033
MNSKLYKIGFFVLLAINIGLVALFVFRPKPPIREKGAREQISKKLALTEAQEKQFGEMVATHRKAVRALINEERTLVQSYFEQLSATASVEERQVLLQQIMKLKEDKIVLTYNHFEELKSLCNEEQLAKFDEVMADVIPRLVNASNRLTTRKRPE